MGKGGDESMKVYIAGKITGDPEYRMKFRRAARALETMGNVALNPATLPEGLSQTELPCGMAW